MKVAVIGGNLLGCATVLNLALVDEANSKRRHQRSQQTQQQDPSPLLSSSSSLSSASPIHENLEVTLFERSSRLGGNSLKSTEIDDNLRVEVGTYRTLPLVPNTNLHELVEIVNDQKNTIAVAGRSIRIPGVHSVRRGRRNAVPVRSLWKEGTYRRVVRSFASWDWQSDTYTLTHSGWKLLDLIYRILDNAIWRSLALAGFFQVYGRLSETEGSFARAFALSQLICMLILFLMSPKNVIASWQRQYSFWGTTIPLLFRYGITPAIARGSTIGFIRLLSEIRSRHSAELCATIGTFVNRCGLDNYMRGTGDDFVRIFKYNRPFVNQFLAATVGSFNHGSSLSQLSSLATHFALLDGDECNSDANIRISKLEPHNAALCAGLILAARVTTEVNLKYNSDVKSIQFDADQKEYILTTSDGAKHKFDGVILCASPGITSEDLKIETSRNLTLKTLLGYEKNETAKKKFDEGEEAYRDENNVGASTSPIEGSACSHIAVVVGELNASFFRYAQEKFVPDVVQVIHSPMFCRVERIREGTHDRGGVYTVVCGSRFETGGVFEEMFKCGSVIRYFQPSPKASYWNCALPEGMSVDECTPQIVLGPKFIYAAAFECIAKHPEMDAIAAANAASFFTDRVDWSPEEEREGDGELLDDEDEDEDEDEEGQQG